jgi:hypothetical protein
MSEHQTDEPRPAPRKSGGDESGDNELDFRNVDEEAEHDERGSQGPGPGEQPQREQ